MNLGKKGRKLLRLRPGSFLQHGDGHFIQGIDGRPLFKETLSPGNLILDRGYPVYYRPIKEAP